VWCGKRICVPDSKLIKDVILREAHNSAYSIHPGSTKMYLDLRERYWWYGMKQDIAEYVAICDTCQRTRRTASTHDDSRMKVGRSRYGFHSEFTSYTKGL
jgi:hypothetical protein